MSRRAILIFVKDPEPGRVKTRLAATVGPARAVEIYRLLVAQVFSRLPAEAEAFVLFDPADRQREIEAWLRELSAGRSLSFLPQSSGDLGARLEHAFSTVFALGFDQVAAIGTDCIEINEAIFEEAWAALATHDAALGPSEDGGYYIVALRAPCAALFGAVDWGTHRVLTQTLAQAAKASLWVHLLPKLHDVDTEEDWRRAERRLNSEQCAASITAIMEFREPIIFEPLLMERIWGGRRLETLLGKRLPQGTRVGESWEIVDRPDAQSVVHAGPLRGRTLHELWMEYREAVFGLGLPDTGRFPLLFKLLDAQERLSVQVHPPPDVAARLGGEPKTEMWYFIDALLDSDLYAGLKSGVTREDFIRGLAEGKVADLIHHIPVRAGDAFFIPSGRIHAIGAGNVIFEVQQNSDTTYRVFDWNRVDLDGKPRALHVEESLESINFDDPEPGFVEQHGETVVACDFFRVEKWLLDRPRRAANVGFAVFTVIAGRVACAGHEFGIGDFFLVPPTLGECELGPVAESTTVLRTTIPPGP